MLVCFPQMPLRAPRKPPCGIPESVKQWARYYLCCNFAVFGGALVLGAFRRLIRKPNVGCSLVFGLGISIVGLMRPYEGAVLSALVIFWLLFASRRVGVY